MKNPIKKLIVTSVMLLILLTLLFIKGIYYYVGAAASELAVISLLFAFSIMLIGLIFIIVLSLNVRNTLKALSESIESMIGDQPVDHFSTIEDTMLSKLQSQIIKLRDILKSQNTSQKNEKDAMTALISDISHQLKTPLANLNIYNTLLLDENLGEAQRLEFTRNMESQVEKLNWLMESLIKMSKLETGIIRLKPESQPLSPTVLQAISVVSQKAQDKI